MKIVIIARAIFPMQSPRAFRSLELAKQLAKEHDVTVYALLGKYDYSALEKETELKIKNLGRSRWGNKDSDGCRSESLFWRVMSRLFGRLLQLPQIELIPMVKKAVMAEQGSADLIISVACPHTIHWGVAFAKKQCKTFPVWISDCGDPFMGNVFNTPPSYFKRFEKLWGGLTDFITVPFEGAREAYYEEVRHKIHVIPQGFDFTSTPIAEYKENNPIRFVFAGNVFAGKRDPTEFLEYLSALSVDFKFEVYTKTFECFDKYKGLLGDKLDIHGYIPRGELIKEMSKADFLVNVANVGSVQSPSKLIDYALAGRPVLEVTSEFNEQQTVDEFLKRDFHNAMPKMDISQFDIRNIANRFIELALQKL